MLVWKTILRTAMEGKMFLQQRKMELNEMEENYMRGKLVRDKH